MSDNQEQRVALFAAVTAIAAIVATDLDLAPIDENETPEAHATRLLEAIAPKVQDLQSARDEFEAERDTLKRQVAAYKGMAGKAQREAEALEASMPKKPRAFDTELEPMRPGDLKELIADAETVEIAFVGGGGREVKGIAPRSIAGDAFHDAGHALRLHVPTLTVYGPAPDQQPFEVLGYALILDGEQVAYAPRPDQLTIGSGARYELKDDVAFPAPVAA